MNEGCGRKIKSGEQVASLIRGVLESVTEGKVKNPIDDSVAYGKPTAGDKVEYLTLPPKFIKHAELLLSTGDFDLKYPCCTIVHDDCRDHLWRFPKQAFDLVITDPPYGMRIKAAQKHHGAIKWDDRFPSEVLQAICDTDFIGGLARLGSYFFCRWDNLWDYQFRDGLVLPGAERAIKLRKPKSVLVWDKQLKGGQGDIAHEHIRDYEMALFYPGPEHKFKYRPPSILSLAPTGNNAHPTQKPVELMQQIMDWYEFETVFDPFMGSGTTAIAAKKLGKHFFGFEANETYFNRAIFRISEIENKTGPNK
jgi:site-specific DNA-methyltransferase (adenine-specific)